MKTHWGRTIALIYHLSPSPGSRTVPAGFSGTPVPSPNVCGVDAPAARVSHRPPGAALGPAASSPPYPRTLASFSAGSAGWQICKWKEKRATESVTKLSNPALIWDFLLFQKERTMRRTLGISSWLPCISRTNNGKKEGSLSWTLPPSQRACLPQGYAPPNSTLDGKIVSSPLLVALTSALCYTWGCLRQSMPHFSSQR